MNSYPASAPWSTWYLRKPSDSGSAVKKKEHKLYGAHFKAMDPSAKATRIKFD